MSHVEQALKALEEGWARQGVEIDTSLSIDTYGRHNLHIGRIEIEKSRRGQGLGTKAMEDLVQLADRFGLFMTLSPSTDFGGSSVERLKKFYRRFGFISNKGRHKDFTLSDAMYRPLKVFSFSELPVQQQGEVLDHIPKGKAQWTKWQLQMVEPSFVYKEYGMPGVHPDQVKALEHRISEEGFNVPIVVDGIDGWMEGNHRTVAAKRLGLEWIPAYTRQE